MSKPLGIAAAALLLLTTMRVSAHHAFAATYHEHRLVKVSGTVTSAGVAVRTCNPCRRIVLFSASLARLSTRSVLLLLGDRRQPTVS